MWAALTSSGAEAGAHDQVVAATALSAGWRVATANTRHFDRIPGLDVIVAQLA
jgi:tRNA(fMet)-specific endonuclease VapC